MRENLSQTMLVLLKMEAKQVQNAQMIRPLDLLEDADYPNGMAETGTPEGFVHSLFLADAIPSLR
jgi:hypothetical protein